MKKAIGKKIIVFIALVLSGVLCIGAVFNLARNEKKATFSVLWGREYIFEDTNGLVFSPSQIIDVHQFDGGKNEVSVSIYAIQNKKQDIVFSTENRRYTWNNDMVSKNVTEAFNLNVTQGTITQIHSSVTFGDVIAYYLGSGVQIDEFATGGDFFLMKITVQDVGEMSLGFSMEK